MPFIRILNIVLVAFLITACAGTSIDSRRTTAFDIAKQAGFQSFSINTDVFKLAGFYKANLSPGAATVYIEGDGFAWIDRRTVSPNPTPLTAMGLQLATSDGAQNVIYFARPCQYVDLTRETSCHQKYWTSHRFSSDVLSSHSQALDIMKEQFSLDGFHLVGFSGGGAIAALLASQRNDVLSLRTVAGNLDHVALNKARRVSPLSGSLNPMTDAQKLQNLPQIHYSGNQDTTVPSWVAQGYVNAVGNSNCARTQIITGASHTDGWLPAWRELSREIPAC